MKHHKPCSRAIRSPLNSTMLLAAMVVIVASGGIRANQYLSTGEVAAIGAGSAGVFGLGLWIKDIDSTKKRLLSGPLPLETALQRFLGGKCGPGKRNFLDNSLGSAYTPAAAGVLLTAANVSWPQEDVGKDLTQDLFLFVSGLIATKGITDMAKGIVARPRPLPCLEPGLAGQRTSIDYAYDHHSFFSGHTSGAFFAATFLNKRLRSVMRRELSPDENRDWRWTPPAILFGWASFVGWSRIHAYKHYLSDVIAGALAGYLIAELFYSFRENGQLASADGNTAQILFRVNVLF